MNATWSNSSLFLFQEHDCFFSASGFIEVMVIPFFKFVLIIRFFQSRNEFIDLLNIEEVLVV